jgi:hypothetical protein
MTSATRQESQGERAHQSHTIEPVFIVTLVDCPCHHSYARSHVTLVFLFLVSLKLPLLCLHGSIALSLSLSARSPCLHHHGSVPLGSLLVNLHFLHQFKPHNTTQTLTIAARTFTRSLALPSPLPAMSLPTRFYNFWLFSCSFFLFFSAVQTVLHDTICIPTPLTIAAKPFTSSLTLPSPPSAGPTCSRCVGGTTIKEKSSTSGSASALCGSSQRCGLQLDSMHSSTNGTGPAEYVVREVSTQARLVLQVLQHQWMLSVHSYTPLMRIDTIQAASWLLLKSKQCWWPPSRHRDPPAAESSWFVRHMCLRAFFYYQTLNCSTTTPPPPPPPQQQQQQPLQQQPPPSGVVLPPPPPPQQQQQQPLQQQPPPSGVVLLR